MFTSGRVYALSSLVCTGLWCDSQHHISLILRFIGSACKEKHHGSDGGLVFHGVCLKSDHTPAPRVSRAELTEDFVKAAVQEPSLICKVEDGAPHCVLITTSLSG